LIDRVAVSYPIITAEKYVHGAFKSPVIGFAATSIVPSGKEVNVQEDPLLIPAF